MKLYDLRLEKKFDKGSYFAVALRYIMGCSANLLVACSFIGSWLWFNYLIPESYKTDLKIGFTQIAAISIIISSSSLILISHRILAVIVLFLRSPMFLKDPCFYYEKDGDFDHFLKHTKPLSHLIGAVLFLSLQLAFGLLVAMLL